MKQQGDVIIERVGRLPNGCRKLDHLVLAEGEVTGHKHEIILQGDLIELYEKDNKMYVKAKSKGLLKHAEHKTIEVDPGIWEVRKVREKDHFADEVREVRD